MPVTKKFNEMTEAEIIKEALRAVPEYTPLIRQTGEFDLDKCVDMELRRLSRLYKESHGSKIYAPLDRKTRQDLDAVLAHFAPLLRDATVPLRQRYLKGRRVQQINATSAGALIKAAFSQAGFKAQVKGQRYRAKVEIPITPKTSLFFYVRYRDLGTEGIMDGIVNAVRDLQQNVQRLGSEVTIKRS